MGLFWPQNVKTKLFCKIICANYRSLSCRNFMQKFERFNALAFENIWKIFLSYWSVLGSIWPKNFKTKSLSINPFASILSLYAALTCVNNQKSTMHLLLTKPEKLHLGSLLVRKTQSKIFSNKILLDQFLAYMLLQLYARNRVNYEGQFFIKLKKPHFGPILDLVAKKQEKIFSQKII